MEANVCLSLISRLLRMNTLVLNDDACGESVCFAWGGGQEDVRMDNLQQTLPIILTRFRLIADAHSNVFRPVCAGGHTQKPDGYSLVPDPAFSWVASEWNKGCICGDRRCPGPNAVQTFEGILYPRTLAGWDRPASCRFGFL